MIIAAAYVRVSTDEQTDYSPAVQLEEIQEYARKNGYHIPAEFIFTDEGISGKRADKRPAFQNMIRQARKKSNHIEYIIVHKFDRFARNKEDSVLYKALLKKDGVKVISVKEPIPQDDKFAVIYESMLEAMAEYYSLNLAEEVKKTMTKKAEMGEWQTTAPFGYRNKDKTLVQDPEEANAVLYLYESYIRGVSGFALSRYLNQMGFKTHRGNSFDTRGVLYILRNPVYKGYARWNPSKRDNYREKTESEIIIAKGNWEPIVSEEMWEQAVSLIQTNIKNRGKHSRAEFDGIHWLSGMVKCSSCGRSLAVGVQYKKGGFQMQCAGYNHGQCHDSHALSSNRLFPILFEALESIARSPSSADVKYSIRHTKPVSDELEAYQTMLEKAKTKLQKAKKAYLEEIDTLEEYRTNKQAIEKEINDLQKRCDSIMATNSKRFDEEAFSSRISSTIEILQSDKYSMDEKKKAFSSIVEKIIYHKHENSIELFLLDG